MSETKSMQQAKRRGLLHSASLVSGMTFFSRILGLVRDILLGYLFGAGIGFDAFLVAFKIPNFFRRSFAEGAFAQAFVPVLAEYQAPTQQAQLRSFVQSVSGCLALVLGIFCLLAMLGAPLVVRIFAPGFSPDEARFHLATHMIVITFPYLWLIAMTALAGGILNSFGRFGVPAFTPALLNVCLIVAAVWVAPYLHVPIFALAWGVLAAGLVQAAFQLPFLKAIDCLPRPRLQFSHPGVKQVIALMIPALIGSSVGQVNLLIDTVFASFLPPGSVSWLYYSDRLTQFPLGIFGVAIGTVILPHLSRRYVQQEPAHYARLVDWGLRVILVIGMPAALGLWVLANPLLTSLFQYGRFGAHDVLMAGLSLRAFAIGLLAFMLIKVLAAGYFARQDTATPVRVAMLALILNTVLNALLIHSFAHAGLALATSISAWLNAGLLLLGLLRRKIYVPQAGWLRFGGQLLLANGLMAAWLLGSVQALGDWSVLSLSGRLWHLFGVMTIAVVIYFSVLGLLGLRLRHFKQQDTRGV